MGLFKKLGLPNADRLDERLRNSLTANPLKNNPVTGAKRLSQIARAGKLGRMPIPGETTVMLRPGKLRLTYQEAGTANLYGGSKLYDPPRPPGLKVCPAGGGDALPLEWAPGTNAIRSGFTNKTTALLAEVEIPGTGEYTISASKPIPDEPGIAKHEDPQLLLDA